MYTSETNRENTKLFFLNKDNQEVIKDSLLKIELDLKLKSTILKNQELIFISNENDFLNLKLILKNVLELFQNEFECNLKNYTIYNKEYKEIKIKVNRLDYN